MTTGTDVETEKIQALAQHLEYDIEDAAYVLQELEERFNLPK